MMKHLMKTGILLGLVFLLCCPNLACTIQAACLQKEMTAESTAEREYWAVIVTTFEYTFFYDVLVNLSDWPISHIRLLSLENATKQHILDALDWVIQQADANDFVVFADNSHGTRKSFDECGIVPWDYDEKGMISTSELNEKFNQINASGLCLIFDCCFAGNFVERPTSIGHRTYQHDNDALAKGVDGENRVILMATRRGGTGASITITDSENHSTTINFIKFIAEAFNSKIDYNNDGICSAEESFRYAKKKYFPYSLFLFFNPLTQLQSLIASGGFLVLPFPTIYDSYDGELPIVQIG
jgi:hypothetical protein